MRDDAFKTLGQGSGFFVSADGLLVTNFHVIEGAKFATVLLSDGSTLFVEGVAAVDREADLWVFRLIILGLVVMILLRRLLRLGW